MGTPSSVEVAARPAPAVAPTSRRPLLILCLGFFMVIVDATIVNTALPAIGTGLHASVSDLQWVVDGYTLMFACLLLTAGSLGDRVGARRVFLLGVASFTAASALCGLAPTLAVLDGARVVQGVGAALTLPTSLALIQVSYPDRAARARAIGVWAGVGGAAAGIGPVLGGVLTDAVGWRAIFFVNLPIGLAAVVLARRYLVAPPPKASVGLDPPGQLLAVLGAAALVYGLIEGGHGWGSPTVPVALAGAVVAGAAFVVVERRQAEPMLPPALFADRRFTGAVIVGAAINLGFYGELFLLSLYFQDVRGFSPLAAGLALLPQPGLAAVASLLGGRHVARAGPRPVMLTGLVVGALGLIGMAAAGPTTPYVVLVAPLLAIGFGTAYTMPAATAATVEAAPAGQAGVASGALNASRQVGSALGVAVFGALVAGDGDFMVAYRVSVLIGGAVFLAAAAAVVLLVPHLRTGAARGPGHPAAPGSSPPPRRGHR